MKAWFAAIALSFAAPALAAAQPQDISRPGTVAHSAARAGFPESVGALRRINAFRYGEDDISASYELGRGEDFVRITVYIYPAPPTRRSQQAQFCREQMAGVVATVAQQYPEAEQVENGAADPVPGVDEGLGYRAVQNINFPLRSRARPEPVRSESRLYCFVGGDWLVKYRASATLGFDISDLMAQLVRDGPWPGRGPTSIAMR